MPQYLVILSQDKTWVCFSSERVNQWFRVDDHHDSVKRGYIENLVILQYGKFNSTTDD